MPCQNLTVLFYFFIHSLNFANMEQMILPLVVLHECIQSTHISTLPIPRPPDVMLHPWRVVVRRILQRGIDRTAYRLSDVIEAVTKMPPVHFRSILMQPPLMMVTICYIRLAIRNAPEHGLHPSSASQES